MVLDSYDVSIYRNGREQGLDREAMDLICEHSPARASTRPLISSSSFVLASEPFCVQLVML